MFSMCTVCSAQQPKSNSKLKYHPLTGAYNNNLPICFLDTISIQDPILIGFKGICPTADCSTPATRLYLLVSKNTLDTNTSDSAHPLSYLLNRDSYLWYSTLDFMRNLRSIKKVSPEIERFPYYSDFIKHYVEDKEIDIIKYDTIMIKLHDSKSKKDTVVPDITIHKPKYYKGWESYDVIPRKFLLCLVKGSWIYKSLENAIEQKNLDYIYFRVLVPISW